MRVVRNSVFETNSSSVHAMCIIRKPKYLDVNEYTDVAFDFTNFGWEHIKYCDMDKKASYLMTLCFVTNMISEFKKILNTLNKRKIGWRIEVGGSKPYFYFSDSDGADVEKVDYDVMKLISKDYYVDHDTDKLSFLNIIKNEDMLINFLMSNESYIVTGNDNDDSVKIIKEEIDCIKDLYITKISWN